MQTFSNLFSLTRCIFIFLNHAFFLSAVLLASPVNADDGDFLWARAIGGNDHDRGNAIAVDTSGNVYTTGFFNGTVDFDPGPGVFNLTSGGTTNNIFISKFDSNGNLVWAKAIGGALSCIGYGIAVDTSGNVYTTGFFWGTVDFDPGLETFELASKGWSDIFISKLDSKGNFVWAKNMGGTIHDNGNAIAVDASGNVYTTGYFGGTADFDPGTETFELTSVAGSNDIFISKLDSNGDFVWAKAIGGTEDVIAYGIAIDTSGNVYTTGYFEGTTDFDPGAETFDLTSAAGSQNIFINKLDSNGNFVWAKDMVGNNSGGEGHCITIDNSGNVYTTGYFDGSFDFDPGPATFDLTSSAGSLDIFISKLTSSGEFVWAKAVGGTSHDRGHSITVDASGNLYTTGVFSDTVDFDPGTGIYNLTSEGWYDILSTNSTAAATLYGPNLWVEL